MSLFVVWTQATSAEVAWVQHTHFILTIWLKMEVSFHSMFAWSESLPLDSLTCWSFVFSFTRVNICFEINTADLFFFRFLSSFAVIQRVSFDIAIEPFYHGTVLLSSLVWIQMYSGKACFAVNHAFSSSRSKQEAYWAWSRCVCLGPKVKSCCKHWGFFIQLPWYTHMSSFSFVRARG